jgi:hypothetical protein
MLRHNLDGMHTEKNNFEDLFYIIMDISEKTKYNDNAHIDEAQLCNLDEDEGPRVRITLSCELDTIKFTGLKNHDCHVVMELLLPVAFRDFLPNEVREPLTKLSIFFKELFGTEIDPILLAQLEKKCDFHHMQVREQQFPTGFKIKFFSIMSWTLRLKILVLDLLQKCIVTMNMISMNTVFTLIHIVRINQQQIVAYVLKENGMMILNRSTNSHYIC